MADDSLKFGQKIEYDPLWKGPIQKVRRKTDSPYLIAFLVFVVLWFALIIYSFTRGTFLADIHRHPFIRSITISTLGAIAFTPFLTVGFILLLRWFARAVVYTFIVLICILLLIFCIAAFAVHANTHKTEQLVFGIGAAIALGVTIALVIWLRNKIRAACEIIRESCKVVLFFPCSLVFPIIPYILFLLVLILALQVCDSIVIYNDKLRGGSTFTQVLIYIFHVFNVCAVFWISSFIGSFTDLVLSGAFATWFWNLHKEYVPKNSILRSLATSCRYHLGTVSFGSLIIAVCQLICTLLSYIQRRFRGSNNSLACCCFGWYKYLFENLEKFVECISRGAFVMTAVHGTSFIKSAKTVFQLFMRNIVHLLVTTNITNGIILLGVSVVSGILILITWICCKDLPDDQVTANVSVATFFSVTISYFLFNVVDIAVNTIFICSLEDSERNDGSEERPYFMNPKLRKWMMK